MRGLRPFFPCLNRRPCMDALAFGSSLWFSVFGTPLRYSYKCSSEGGIPMLKLHYHGHDCWEFSDGQHRVLIDPFLSGNPLADVKAEVLFLHISSPRDLKLSPIFQLVGHV